MPHSFSNPLQLSRTALAVMLAFGTLHAQAVDNAPTHYSEHDEKAAIGTAPQPAPAKKLLKSGALKTIGFIDDEPVVNSLTGPLHGGVKFAQTHTIDPAGNSAKEMPTLITDRGALLMFIPQDKNAERKSVKVTATLDGKELGTLEMAPPADFPKSDQNNFSSGYRVEYTQHAWTADLPWQWMKKGLALHFADGNGQRGDLAADKIEFAGSPEYVAQFIRLGMLTDFGNPTYVEQHPEKAVIDYFQKIPVGKLTFGYYLPIKLDKVELSNGTIYTTRSNTEGSWHGGDMRYEIAKSLISMGINYADIGISSSFATDQTPLRPYRQIAVHNAFGLYTNGRIAHGGSGGGTIGTLESTQGNELSHELGHDHDMGHYPGGGKWSTHNQHSGWGYDDFYHRMIGNLAWGWTGEGQTVEGYFAPSFLGIFNWNRDAMAGGWAEGNISAYTLHTGYTAKRIQNTLNATPLLDSSSSTGYSSWNNTKQKFETYSNAKYPKPAKTGIPVITLLGDYDPDLNLPGMMYPALFGSWGNTFDLAKPNESSANVCWLNVHYPDHDLKVDLHAARYRSGQLNKFSVNVPMAPFPESAQVMCKRSGTVTEIAHETITRPAQLPIPAVTVGKEAGYSAAARVLERTLNEQAGKPFLELDMFAAAAAAHMSESDIQSLSPTAREGLARYLQSTRSVAEVDRWAADYAKKCGNAPVTQGAQQELRALLQRLHLSFPAHGDTLKVGGYCLARSGSDASVMETTKDCDTPFAKSWILDAKGHLRTLTQPGSCVQRQGAYGAPLRACNEGALQLAVRALHGAVQLIDEQSPTQLLTKMNAGHLGVYGDLHGSSIQNVVGLTKDDGALLAFGKPETLNVVGHVLSAEAVPDPALPPEAKADADRTVVATTNARFVYPLDGTQSSDPAGKALTYQWRVVSGPFTLNRADQAKAEAVVPRNTTGTGVYELTVTNAAGQSAKATTKVIAIAPQVTLSGNATSIDEKQAASYRAQANFDSVTYTWSVRNASNQEVETGSGASWSTPTSLAAGSYKVSVRAYSTKGERTATAEQALTVKAAPKPEPAPELTAKISGPAQAESGATVTLDASASSGPKDMFVHWMAAKGDMRDQSGGNFGGKRLIVQMPQVSKDTPLTFKLTAYAEGGKFNNTTTHTIVVKAKAAPQPEPKPEPTPSAPRYQAGKAYSAGDVVSNGGKLYECKPWPYTGWCGQAPAAYEPGKGWAWQDAWIAK